MEDVSTRLAELIRQGKAAERVGERERARDFYAEALRMDPNSVEALLGLSGVIDDRAEKEHCFARVLEIDPGNKEARAGLEWIARHQNPPPAPAEEQTPTVLYCANHPQVETVLRCNRCNKPICDRCAVQTPVGYRCKECVAELQSHFYNARGYDYPLAMLAAFFLSALASGVALWVIRLLPFNWLIMLFLAPAIAGGIAEAVRRLLGKRRGRSIWLAAAAAAAAGALLGLGMVWLFTGTLPLILFLIFVVFLVSTLSMRLR